MCSRLSQFLDLAVAKSLQSTRTVTDAADDADVLTTTGYTCFTGQPSLGQERDRLRTCYSISHGYKNTSKVGV